MDKKTLSTIILLIIVIPFFIYMLSFRLVLFDNNFYSREFAKYGIYGRFSDANEVNSGVLDYFRREKGDNLIENDFFNQREKEHMLDVKKAVQSILSALNITSAFLAILIAAFVFLVKNKAKYSSIVLMSSGFLASLLALILFLLLKMDFGGFFSWLHSLFFKPGSWLFSSGNMVQLYTQGFFYDFSIKLGLTCLIFSVMLILAGAAINACASNKKLFKPAQQGSD